MNLIKTAVALDKGVGLVIPSWTEEFEIETPPPSNYKVICIIPTFLCVGTNTTLQMLLLSELLTIPFITMRKMSLTINGLIL